MKAKENVLHRLREWFSFWSFWWKSLDDHRRDKTP
jgi:hypothetical protein